MATNRNLPAGAFPAESPAAGGMATPIAGPAAELRGLARRVNCASAVKDPPSTEGEHRQSGCSAASDGTDRVMPGRQPIQNSDREPPEVRLAAGMEMRRAHHAAPFLGNAQERTGPAPLTDIEEMHRGRPFLTTEEREALLAPGLYEIEEQI